MYDSAELPHVLVVAMVGSILSRPAVSFSAHVHAEERLVQVLTGFRESGVYIPEPRSGTESGSDMRGWNVLYKCRLAGSTIEQH
jgi:hypothetical protein